MNDRDALRGANESLRATLTTPRPRTVRATPRRADDAPATLRPGRRLTPLLSRVLDGLIRRHPAEPAPAIVARFAAATGVVVTPRTVHHRRPGPADRHPTRPLSARERCILAEVLRAHPEATAPAVAARFRAATGRPLSRLTVLRYAPGRKVYRAAADWPAWTDAVAFGPAWREDERVILGPAAGLAKGGAR